MAASKQASKFAVSGHLTEKDMKRLTRITRGGTVGPTVIYYAGVTAPIISAAMAMMVREAMKMAGLVEYWQWFISTLVAAFAGITWYLIFIRWSYRHQHGRGTEVSLETEISMTDDAILVRRGDIHTRIGWASIEEVQTGRGFTAVRINGADALIVPDKWFAKDKAAKAAFVDHLKRKAPH